MKSGLAERINFGSKRRPLSGPGYLLLGDAGSLIDPFSGEGISHAMVSGRHAADWAARALAAYDLDRKSTRLNSSHRT